MCHDAVGKTELRSFVTQAEQCDVCVSYIFRYYSQGNMDWKQFKTRETHKEIQENKTSDRCKTYFAQSCSMTLKFGYNLQQIFLEIEKPQYWLSESRDDYMFVPQDRAASAGGVTGARNSTLS